jgi:hypothetical protein
LFSSAKPAMPSFFMRKAGPPASYFVGYPASHFLELRQAADNTDSRFARRLFKLDSGEPWLLIGNSNACGVKARFDCLRCVPVERLQKRERVAVESGRPQGGGYFLGSLGLCLCQSQRAAVLNATLATASPFPRCRSAHLLPFATLSKNHAS